MKKLHLTKISNGLNKKTFFIILSLFLLFIIDRISKYIALNKLVLKQVYLFKEIISLELQTNIGIAFSIPLPQILIIVFIITIIYILIFYIYKAKLSLLKTFLILLIIIGAFSNLLDRLIYGNVIDFVNIWIWPTFNLSDSYIFIAIVILIILNLRNNSDF